MMLIGLIMFLSPDELNVSSFSDESEERDSSKDYENKVYIFPPIRFSDNASH